MALGRIPTERSAVQEPLLRYATEIGWSRLSQEDALTLRPGESEHGTQSFRASWSC